MRRSLILIFSLLAFLAFPALGQEEETSTEAIAKVGHQILNTSDIEAIVHKRSAFARRSFEDGDRLKKLVDAEIDALVLATAAKNAGLDKDAAVREAINKQLVQLFVRKEIDEQAEAQATTEADARIFYAENVKRYEQPEHRRASHIVVKSETKALEIAKKAKGLSPQNFVALARENSLDEETRLRGGDLLYFTTDGRPMGGSDAPVDKALVTAAFSIKKVGELAAKPIELGNDRFSVVRLTDIRAADRKEFAQAKPAITRLIGEQRKRAHLEELIQELKGKVKPERFLEKLDWIVLPPLKVEETKKHGH